MRAERGGGAAVRREEGEQRRGLPLELEEDLGAAAARRSRATRALPDGGSAVAHAALVGWVARPGRALPRRAATAAAAAATIAATAVTATAAATTFAAAAAVAAAAAAATGPALAVLLSGAVSEAAAVDAQVRESGETREADAVELQAAVCRRRSHWLGVARVSGLEASSHPRHEWRAARAESGRGGRGGGGGGSGGGGGGGGGGLGAQWSEAQPYRAEGGGGDEAEREGKEGRDLEYVAATEQRRLEGEHCEAARGGEEVVGDHSGEEEEEQHKEQRAWGDR